MEVIKLICGLILVSFAILGGLIFYLESFNFVEAQLSLEKVSPIFSLYESDLASSNVPIFLGLCGIAGAYLLASVKPVKSEVNSVNT